MSAQPPDAAADPDDRSLLAAHVDGDPEAFGVLFGRHRDRLWAVALRTTGNPDDAADALQDAMISAFRRAETYRGDAQVTTWLHRIVVNACLDRIRRAKVRAVQALPDDLEEYAARGDVLAADPASGAGTDPEAAAERSELRSQVLAALDELPPDQRSALVLVDMQGYPVEEAARILECPAGTVKSRCSRGRARLAGILGDLGPAAAPDRSTASPPTSRPRRGQAPGSGTDPPQDSSNSQPVDVATGPHELTPTDTRPPGQEQTQRPEEVK
ncbi:MAG: RNA polymerase sigma factor SigM [Marmoricola sp.]